MNKSEPQSQVPRILHIISGLESGGAERSLYSLLTCIADDATDHRVVSLTSGGRYVQWIQRLGVPVKCLHMRPGRINAGKVFRLLRDVAEYQPDIVQGWMYHGNLAASFIGAMSACHPHVFWNIRHSLNDLGQEKASLKLAIYLHRHLAKRAAGIVYNSNASRRQHERFGISSAKGRIVPNGFDLNVWKPDTDKRAALRTALGVPSNALLLGHVARYHPAKDHHLFLRAAAKVLERYSGVHIVMVGSGVDRTNADIAKRVSGMRVGHVHLMGECSVIHDVMPAFDVLCLSSRTESFPNVVGEAMSCGIPCVTTDVGDCKELVGDTGGVVAPGDIDGLASTLEQFLRMTSEERAERGRLARRKVESAYSLDAVATLYRTMYWQVLGAKGDNLGASE